MTTFFISNMDGLPLTPDNKIIDIWSIFYQFLHFSATTKVTLILN